MIGERDGAREEGRRGREGETQRQREGGREILTAEEKKSSSSAMRE